MQIFNGKSFAGLAATLLALSCLGFGFWGSHKSSERATEVTFTSAMTFNNGDTLPAGTYRMEVPENSPTPEVMFYKEDFSDGTTLWVAEKPTATIPAKVVTHGEKNSDTEVFSVASGNAQMVTKIQPKGWDETLTFGPAGSQGSAHGGK